LENLLIIVLSVIILEQAMSGIILVLCDYVWLFVFFVVHCSLKIPHSGRKKLWHYVFAASIMFASAASVVCNTWCRNCWWSHNGASSNT